MNDLARRVVRPASVLQNGLHVLSEGLRSLVSRVVLDRAPALTRPRHFRTQRVVTGSAEPAEIRFPPVRFVPVDVIYHHIGT